MQPIAAATRLGVVEWRPKSVATDQPFQRPSRGRDPRGVAGRAVRLQGGGDRRVNFDGLPVPQRPGLAGVVYGCDSTLCGVWSGFGERGKRDYGDDETE